MRKILVLFVSSLCLVGMWCSAEPLAVNGTFLSPSPVGITSGWSPNAPKFWDNEGSVLLNKIPDSKKNSLRMAPKTKNMHLFFTKRWPIAQGGKCVIKAKVKGEGTCAMGIYAYPAGAVVLKTCELNDDWVECVAEIIIASNLPIKKLSIVLSVDLGSWAEFSDVSAEIIEE